MTTKAQWHLIRQILTMLDNELQDYDNAVHYDIELLELEAVEHNTITIDIPFDYELRFTWFIDDNDLSASIEDNNTMVTFTILL